MYEYSHGDITNLYPCIQYNGSQPGGQGPIGDLSKLPKGPQDEFKIRQNKHENKLKQLLIKIFLIIL